MTLAVNLANLANYVNNAGQVGAATGLVGSVPIANGGTGATTAADARTNLAVPSTTGSGASGTWPIAISGNAATATNATNAQTAQTAQTVANISVSDVGNANLNTIVTSGFYRVNSPSNKPVGASDYGQLLVVHGAGDTIGQTYYDYASGVAYSRAGNPPQVGGTGSYSPWVAGGGIGYGQGWQDVTGSRAANTWYQNTTSKPIMVNASIGYASTTEYAWKLLVGPSTELYCNTSQYNTGNYANGVPLSAIVPPGWYYQVSAPANGFRVWAELR